MKHPRTALVMLALAVLFLIANRGAFKGYFSADDLNNLAWTAYPGPQHWLEGLLTPKFSVVNYRPAGHVWYGILGNTFGLNFVPFVWFIQLLHLANAALLWGLLRRMGAGQKGAAAGALIFVFHMACFDTFWMPMYLFDVVCCLLLLCSLLLYTGSRWWLGLITFWLAYKSKEIAVALPAFLAAYEYWTGEKRWLRVLPFAAISGWFAAQALLANGGEQTYYTLQFTGEAVRDTLKFYSSEILFVPYAGLILIPLFFLAKEPRVRLGLAGIALLMGPLWFLPGRLFSVYLYVPLVGAAIAVAFAADKWRTWMVALLLAVWIPFNFMVMREKRKATLALADENRPYVEAIGRLHSAHPELRTILFESRPEHLPVWGIEGAFQCFYRVEGLKVADAGDPASAKYFGDKNLAVVGWVAAEKRLPVTLRDPARPFPNRILIGEASPVWAIGEGWLWAGGSFRWTLPKASARMLRPAGATRFEVRIYASKKQVDDQGGISVAPVVDGEKLGVRMITTEGWHTEHWLVRSGAEKQVDVDLVFPAPYRPAGHTGEPFGTTVGGLGFAQ